MRRRMQHARGPQRGDGLQNAANQHPSQQQRAPFIKNTRQRIQSAGAQIAIPAGGQTPWTSQPFPQVGLVNRLILHVRVILNAGASAFAAVAKPAYKGPWNFLKNVSLDLNLGSTNLIKCSGFGLSASMLSKKRGFALGSCGPLAAGTGRDPFFNVGYNGSTVIAANANFTAEFVLILPLAGNNDDNFTMGLINFQSPEVQVILSGTYGAVSDLFANASGTTTITGGYMQPYVEYYEVPPPSRRVALPPLLAHRIAEDSQTITSSGVPFNYQIPRQGKLLRLISYYDNAGSLILTGSPVLASGSNQSPTSNGILSFQVLANNTDSVYAEDYIVKRLLMQEFFGDYPNFGSSPTNYTANVLNGFAQQPHLNGGFLWEYWGATGEPARGNFRDVFDAEALTMLNFITNFDSGLTINAGATGFFVKEFWQPLAAGVARGLMGR